MNPLARTTTSAVFVGRACVFARVTRSPLGATATPLGMIDDITTATDEQIRQAAGAPASLGTLVVTLPAESCVLRPIALDRAAFRHAREELRRAADEMFPFAPDDTLLGYIARDADDAANTSPAGTLVAAQRSCADQLLEPLRRALNARPAAVLAPQQAMLGLGLTDRHTARVAERSPLGTALVHTLRRGVPVALAEPDNHPAGAHDATIPTTLPEHNDDAVRIAIGAALARSCAASHVIPLAGRATPLAVRMATPLVVAGVAAMVVLVAAFASETRLEHASATLARTTDSRAAEAAELRRDLGRLDRLNQLIASARALGIDDPPTTVVALDAAHRVLPDDAFLTQLTLTPRSVAMRGAAERAQAVLRNLEASDAFTAARQDAPSQRFGLGEPPIDTYETFDLTATRDDAEEGTR